MICNRCGKMIPDDTRFCPNCGNVIQMQQVPSREPQQQQQQQYQNYDPQPSYPDYQNYQIDPMMQPQAAAVNQPPMNWFKFIIYVQLFLSAALNLINAIGAFNGSHYDGSADLVYGFFPGQKTNDMIYGVCLLILVALAIYARFRLAGFKRNGPTMYYLFCGLSLVFALLYLILSANTLGVSITDVMTASTTGTLIGMIVLLVINLVYFGKRKHLFVN